MRVPTIPGFNDTEENKMVFNKDDFYIHETQDYTIKWIIPDAQKRQMEPIIINLNPHSKSSVLRPHTGEEFGFVGAFTLILLFILLYSNIIK